jgi:hypothetical protein
MKKLVLKLDGQNQTSAGVGLSKMNFTRYFTNETS